MWSARQRCRPHPDRASGKENAITAAMYQSMADALAAQEDAAVRAILICGEKTIFTAGNDLKTS